MTESRAEQRLRELVSALDHHRMERNAANSRGDEAHAQRTLAAIRIDHALIRSHCAETGLPRPHDVPETD